MSKRTRRQTIVEIVDNDFVPNQVALANELKTHGFQVTQATVCRDVAALGLLKSSDGYIRRKGARRTGGLTFYDLNGTIKRLVLDVVEADNMVVLKTARGSAKQVGFAIDNNLCDQVVGTVAGLDTVLLATRSPADASSLRNTIESLIS